MQGSKFDFNFAPFYLFSLVLKPFCNCEIQLFLLTLKATLLVVLKHHKLGSFFLLLLVFLMVEQRTTKFCALLHAKRATQPHTWRCQQHDRVPVITLVTFDGQI